MKSWLIVTMMVLSACGESDEERICSAAMGCGALSSAEYDACVDGLADVDAERVLEECADCLETATCEDISNGACIDACPSFGGRSDEGPPPL